MSEQVLLRVESVSKKFCKSLKQSLVYGVQDIVADLIPFRRSTRDNGRRRKSGHVEHQGSGVKLRRGEFWALDDVSFELRRSECLGLIGANGAGKTTLLKMLNGLIRPDHGRIEMHGRVGALIALGAGFNPILTGRENIYVNGSVLGLSKREIDEKVDEIIDFAEIWDFIDSPVQSYSSGMQVRLGFAVATALEPDVLLLDEVLAVGDMAFRTKCFQRIGAILDRCAVIFVSHDAVQVSRICDYCLYLKAGHVAAAGPTADVQKLYERDHSPGLGAASVVIDHSVSRFECRPSEASVDWGSTFDLTIRLELNVKGKIGLALLALVDGEASVAQADVTNAMSHALASSSKVDLRFGPIYLRQGTYGLAITILNESRKGTLVHAVNAMSVQVGGPQGYGVAYQVPVSEVK